MNEELITDAYKNMLARNLFGANPDGEFITIMVHSDNPGDSGVLNGFGNNTGLINTFPSDWILDSLIPGRVENKARLDVGELSSTHNQRVQYYSFWRGVGEDTEFLGYQKFNQSMVIPRGRSCGINAGVIFFEVA